MINNKHNFIFLHIPKNAGTTITSAILSELNMRKNWPRGWHRQFKKYKQHFTLSEYIDYGFIDSETANSYFKFAFVRNPWDKLLSEFFYRKKLHGNAVANWTFKGYLQQSWGGNNMRHLAIKQHIRPQHEFLYDTNGIRMVDFIGRFENLKEDFGFVCNKLGIKNLITEVKYNTNHKHYTEYYDDETRSIVAEKYKKDIEYFNYEFGE